MNSTLESADDAGKFFTVQATARILENVGFTSAQGSSINILSDMMKKYFELLCTDAKNVAEHSGRTMLNMSDVNTAFRNRHVRIPELQDYLKQVQSFTAQKPIPQFPLPKPDHDIRGPLSKKELNQRLEEEFPIFLPAIHREWVEEEQPRPSRPTASTSKVGEPQPSTSQQQIEIKIEDMSLREENKEEPKMMIRKGNRIRPKAFPTFIGRTVKDLGFPVIHVNPPKPVRRIPSPITFVQPALQPVIEERIQHEIPVENIPKIEAPVPEKIEKKIEHVPEFKPILLQQESVLSERQEKLHKEHKKEKKESKKKKKDKDRDRERDRSRDKDRDRKKHHDQHEKYEKLHKRERFSSNSGQDSIISSSTGPNKVDADSSTRDVPVASSHDNFDSMKRDIPLTSDIHPSLIWDRPDSPNITNQFDHSPMPTMVVTEPIVPFEALIQDNSEEDKTQPFVEGAPMGAETLPTLQTTFPTGLTLETEVKSENGQKEGEGKVPTMEKETAKMEMPHITIKLSPNKSLSASQESPTKEKKKKKEHRTHEEKEQRRIEKKLKKHADRVANQKAKEEALEMALFTPLPPPTLPKMSQKPSIPAPIQEPPMTKPSTPPRPVKEPSPVIEMPKEEPTPPLTTPPVVIELEKFEYPTPPELKKEKDKEKKKKKEKTDEERKKKKEERKRKHAEDGDDNHHHKKKKKKHDRDEPLLEESLEPKVPTLKLKIKIGPSPSTSLTNSPQPSPIRKSAEQPVVAPLKISRPQPVPSSEQVKAEATPKKSTEPQLRPSSATPTPEKSKNSKKVLSDILMGRKTTQDVPKTSIKLSKKPSDEKMEIARDTSATPTKMVNDERTPTPIKITSDKMKEKSNSITTPKKSSSPTDMNKVERPSAVGMPPTASIKIAGKNGKARVESKISIPIKKKTSIGKITKQNSTEKVITVDKVKKEKKAVPPPNMNFLFADAIKTKKPPIHAEPAAEEDEKVWICPVCSVAYVEGADMVACDGCDEWFHWLCVGLISAPSDNEPWFCPTCTKKREKQTSKGAPKKKEKTSAGAGGGGMKEKKKKIVKTV